MAAYRLEAHPRVARDLARLPKALQARVSERIDHLAREPRPRGCEKLVGPEAYRLRIGDYRVLYEVDDKTRKVYLVRVAHRREVYRSLR